MGHIRKARDGVGRPVQAGDFGFVPLDLLRQGPVDSLDHAPFTLVCQAVWVDDLALVVAYA